MEILLFWLVLGAIYASIVAIPGLLLGTMEVKRLFNRRFEAGLNGDQLCARAGWAVALRVFVSFVITEMIMIGYIFGSPNYYAGERILVPIGMAPAMFVLTFLSYRSGGSNMRRRLLAQAPPSSGSKE